MFSVAFKDFFSEHVTYEKAPLLCE